VGKALDIQATRLLALSSALLKSAASIADLKVPVLEDIDDLENNWRGIVDVVDSLLEKTDICLDEYTGARKRKEDSSTTEIVKSKSKNHFALGNSFRTQNLVKPQLAFDVKVSSYGPLAITESPIANIGYYSLTMTMTPLGNPYSKPNLTLRNPWRTVWDCSQMSSIKSSMIMLNSFHYYYYPHPHIHLRA